MKRRRPCVGCGADRKRWQRLCDSCFAILPADVRNGVIVAHRHKRMAEWRQWVRRARELILVGVRSDHPPVTPQTVYARNQALLGERER